MSPELPCPSSVETITSWAELWEYLDEFSPREENLFEEGIFLGDRWIFRGLRSSKHDLSSSIERKARESESTLTWVELEKLTLDYFKASAHQYLAPQLIPTDDISWLALMQHHGAPTRLLDFSYSPIVALYFCVRRSSREDKKGDYMRLWAIDTLEVHEKADSVLRKFGASIRRNEPSLGLEVPRPQGPFVPVNFRGPKDDIEERLSTQRLAAKIISSADRHEKTAFQKKGLCYVFPPTFYSPRLSAQRGVFLSDLSDSPSLEESLSKMMAFPTQSDPGHLADWYRVADIRSDIVEELEERLFQMNIHEQSLFPDISGLAGLLNQRIRMHW